jgi:hypothetical protein
VAVHIEDTKNVWRCTWTISTTAGMVARNADGCTCDDLQNVTIVDFFLSLGNFTARAARRVSHLSCLGVWNRDRVREGKFVRCGV